MSIEPSWLKVLDSNAIATLGASLRRINQNLMKAGDKPNSTRVWYQGKEPYFDVLFELEHDRIVWFQLTLRGKVLSWSEQQAGIRTGETDELDIPPDVAYYAASKTIRDGGNVDQTFVEIVKGILASRPDDDLFQTMLTLLNQATVA